MNGRGVSAVSVFRDPKSAISRMALDKSAAVREKKREAAMKKTRNELVAPAADNRHAPSFNSSEKLKLPEVTEARESILEKARRLPIYAVKERLLTEIAQNPVVVVVGETGSGKSTQLPQYIMDDPRFANKITGTAATVAVTQPRRVAAVGVATRVAAERGVLLGQEVGYAIRFDRTTSSSTRLTYQTDGVLLREALTDPSLSRYSVVIVDEAHERSLDTDVLLALLHTATSTRNDLRVVIMSATIESRQFQDHFHAPLLEIKTKPFPIDVHYTRSCPSDYVEAAAMQVLAIHKEPSSAPGDILVFMSGKDDIDATCAAVRAGLAELVADGVVKAPLWVLPMYGLLRGEDQARIFAPTPPGVRKVVVATNIAETSLTVDGIVHVVDSGMAKTKVYHPTLGMDLLQLCPVSQAAADQRRGRAGRTQPGVCYRMYPEREYKNEMLPATPPEIVRANLANVCLLLLTMGQNPLDWIAEGRFIKSAQPDHCIHAPAARQAMGRLWLLGAVEFLPAPRLTAIGRTMARFPLEPTLARMVVAGGACGCVAEILTIVAMLSVPGVWYRPTGAEIQADAAREHFTDRHSDHLTLLNLYTYCAGANRGARDPRLRFVHRQHVSKAQAIRGQLVGLARQAGLNPASTCGQQTDKVREAIAAASLANVGEYSRRGMYTNVRTGCEFAVHPTSALAGAGAMNQYVVYNELVFTQREYVQTVTAVDPVWLARAGPTHYALRTSTHSAIETEASDRAAQAVLDRVGSTSAGEASGAGQGAAIPRPIKRKARRRGVI